MAQQRRKFMQPGIGQARGQRAHVGNGHQLVLAHGDHFGAHRNARGIDLMQVDGFRQADESSPAGMRAA